jgi:phosphoenolpyruvate carboxylase
LGEFEKHHPGFFAALKQLAQEWYFLKYSLIQIESNLLNSDVRIMKKFAELVGDADTSRELLDLVLTDYQTGLNTIEQLLGGSAEVRRISRLEDTKLRNAALEVLHEIQIDYLKTWRSIQDTEPDKNDENLLRLLMLVNALSGGLKGTG